MKIQGVAHWPRQVTPEEFQALHRVSWRESTPLEGLFKKPFQCVAPKTAEYRGHPVAVKVFTERDVL